MEPTFTNENTVVFTKQNYLDAFKAITDKMNETTKKKNADYSGDLDPFQNFRMVEKLGISDAQTAIMVRMTDKMTRIATLLKKEAQVKEESIEDTLLDLAVYSIILMVYRKANTQPVLNYRSNTTMLVPEKASETEGDDISEVFNTYMDLRTGKPKKGFKPHSEVS